MNNFKKEKIISLYVNIISITEFMEKVKSFLLLKKGHYICVSNALVQTIISTHTLNSEHENIYFVK